MTYLLLAGGLLFLVILAVRSFRRYREEQAAQLTELRRAAERHGWNCVIAPTLDVIVRITGTTDGIAWTVQQYEARGESDFPTVHWSSGGADARPIIIYVGDVQSVPALRGATGEWLLGLAERALAGHGVPIQQLRDFFARAEVVAFASAALGARYSALTTSRELAATVLTPAVEALLLEWPGAGLNIQIGNQTVGIRWASAELQPAALQRVVALGVLLAQRRLAGAESLK